MKWKLIFIGKETNRNQWEKEYEKRILHTQKIEITTLKPGKGTTGEEKKRNEAEHIMKRIDNTDIVILLDETGKNLTTKSFVEKINTYKEESRNVVFIIGGAYGTDTTIKNRANLTLSFSAMTWTYDLCRLMLLEQLYRATQIMNGKPFHKE